MNHEHPSGQPIDPATGRPLPLTDQPGYYPGYTTLAQQDFWDEATRQVVLDRVNDVPPIRFFTGDELRTMRVVVDRLLPQDDREPSRRIPVVNYIDDRLHRNVTEGYRYEDMPADRDAFRLGLKAIDEIALHLHQRPFVELATGEQDQVLWTIHDADPPAGDEIWGQMEVDRFWLLLMGSVTDAYYAHPFSWDEIGFGGPAFPRGYMRLQNGLREPWEVEEARYEWNAPPGSSSDAFRPVGGGRQHHPPPGQAGTH